MATLSITNLGPQNEGSTGGTTNFVFTITRTNGTGASTVDYTLTPGAGVDAADFSGGLPPLGTVSFLNGETSKTISFAISADNIIEATETFTVTLSNATGADTIGGTNTATGTITNDDVAGTVTVGDVSVNENSGTATLTLTRTGGNAAFAVSYATSDFAAGPTAATAGTDYTAVALQTVNFAANENSKTITFNITPDTVVEQDEAFAVDFSAGTNGIVIAAPNATYATVNILNDDTSFTIATPAAQNEGSSQTTSTPYVFTVTRNGSSAGQASVGYTITNGTTNPTNAADFAGALSGTLVFPNTGTTGTITVPITADFDFENNETFVVTLVSPSAGTTLGATTTAIGTINNDATDIGGNVAVNPTGVTVVEGSGGSTQAEITIVRTAGTSAFSLNVSTQDVSAIAGADYVAITNQVVNFATNQTTASVFVTINGDFDVEGTETFLVNLSNPNNGAVLGANGTVTINDNDAIGNVGVTGVTVVEGNGGNTVANVTITRSSGGAPFTVNYATGNNSAVAGTDYIAASGTLTFAGGETSKTIQVQIVGDTVVEPDENFFVTLSNITTGGVILSGGGVVTITNDDGLPATGGGGNPTQSGNTVFVTGTYVQPADSTATTISTQNNSTTNALDITGNAASQSIIGNYGNNVLNGGGGSDTLYGLLGNDTFVIANSSVIVVENAGEGADAVLTSVDYVLPGLAEVELLSVQDVNTTTNVNLTGSVTSQQITGNAGNNIINGFGGNDTMTGLAGNDQYLVRGPGDVVIEGNGGGSDTVFTTVSYNLGVNEVEVLSTVINADTTPINLIGNFATQLVIGNYGDNVLNGGSGGIDTLIGLRGNDVYAVGDSRVAIVENAGEGSDTVVTAVDYTLAAGVSVEVLAAQDRAGTGALTLRGNEVAQTIVGNNGANTLDGGLGNDTLAGGGGADSFRFSTALSATNVDSIVDFDASDKIGLAQSIFGITAVNAINFTAGGVASAADHRIVYNQGTGQLFFDADGNGAGAAVLFALLAPNTALTVASFEVF